MVILNNDNDEANDKLHNGKEKAKSGLEFQFLENIKNVEDGFEDEFLSEQIFQKLSIQEFLCAFFSTQCNSFIILAIISSIMYYELFTMTREDILDIQTWKKTLDFLAIFTSIFTILFSKYFVLITK